MVDIDDDGDLDLFIAQSWSYISPSFTERSLDYYENVSTDPKSPEFMLMESYPFGIPDDADISFLSFVDIDGDGDQDLFTTDWGWNATFSYIENTGSPEEPFFEASSLVYNPFGLDPSGIPRGGLVFGDIDNDGDYDLFINGRTGGNYGDYFVFQKNIGTPTNPEFAPREINPFGLSNAFIPDGLTWAALADWDCDGDIDILNALWDVETTGLTSLFFHENKLTELDTVYFEEGVLTDTALIFTQGDLDGDGDLDAMVQYYYGENISLWCDTTVSVVETRPVVDIQISPNPSTDYLHLSLQTETSLRNVNLSIIDALGRPVWQAPFDFLSNEITEQIDVSALPNGLYTLRLMQEGMVVGKPFVVMRE
ncbi:MAG: T9SS type A sorting domain-containing protein [Lewinellaceae bacterium]|nr:T9SS type A sorting domain-containing protein [Lewinellaceae bacterium]